MLTFATCPLLCQIITISLFYTIRHGWNTFKAKQKKILAYLPVIYGIETQAKGTLLACINPWWFLFSNKFDLYLSLSYQYLMYSQVQLCFCMVWRRTSSAGLNLPLASYLNHLATLDFVGLYLTCKPGRPNQFSSFLHQTYSTFQIILHVFHLSLFISYIYMYLNEKNRTAYSVRCSVSHELT